MHWIFNYTYTRCIHGARWNKSPYIQHSSHVENIAGASLAKGEVDSQLLCCVIIIVKWTHKKKEGYNARRLKWVLAQKRSMALLNLILFYVLYGLTRGVQKLVRTENSYDFKKQVIYNYLLVWWTRNYQNQIYYNIWW